MDAAHDVANRGVVRPPLVYLVAILTGSALEVARPLPFLPRGLGTGVGMVLVVLALALFVHAVRTFRAAGTPVPGNLPATTIVRSGAYRFTRNPIYVAFSVLQLGIAIWADSLWLVATLIAAAAVMDLVVVPREERYLEQRFGRAYTEYRASVRRWL